jgi:methyl-accepting chemotaxis protein
MKISTKFSVVSGIVVFIVITILSLSTYLLVENTLKEKTQAYVEDNAFLLSQGISNWLAGKRAQIGLVKSNIEDQYSVDAFQHGLEIATLKNDFLLMFGTLADETVLRSNNPNRKDPDNVDFRQRAWFKQGQNGSGVMFTQPYVDAATKELLLSVVAPINDNRVFRGVIGGDLSLDKIAKSVNTINFNNTGLAFISDKQGNIISHPEAALNGKNTQQIYNIRPHQEKQIIEINHQGVNKLVYFYPLDETAGVSWYLGVLLEKDKVYQSLSDLSWRTIWFAILSIAICIFILRKLAQKLLLPLNELGLAIAQIASGGGDLTQRLTVKTEDECGALAAHFNTFLSSLQQLVNDIKDKAHRVVDNSDTVKDLSTQASARLVEQSALVQNLATTMNEMSATSTEIASNAQEAASTITSVNQKAQQGQAIFNQTSLDVLELAKTISSSKQLSDQLAKYSSNIEQVLLVISGIAEQTNLLALNAAIEAARAGEQGRGFAVVADEVRTLASRTQESTTEIKTMVEQIQHSSVQVQEAMNQSKTKASSCVEHTETANQTLIDISAAVKDIMDRNIQIAAAIVQQNIVIEETNQNTTHINDISVQVGDFSQQQICSNEKLVDEVNQQQTLLQKFIV